MKSGKNLSVGIIIGAVVLFVVAAAVIIILPRILYPMTTLRFGDGVFNARVINNEGSMNNGLSGEAYFDPDEAVIIIFPSDDRWTVGTKDIKASVDLVWLDGNKKVVYIVKDASPDNPESAIFTPKEKSRYVIELPAGTVSSKAITLGTKAIFEINNNGGSN